MHSEVSPRRLRALGAKAASFLWHPLWGALFLITLVIASLVLLQATPGVPASLRPYTRYKHSRATTFLTQAVQAHQRGDRNQARLAVTSALAMNPGLIPARIELARLDVDENRFDEAVQQAATARMDGTGFVHDLLFYSGRFDDLLAYCAKQVMTGSDGRNGVWLQSALMVAPLTSVKTHADIVQRLPACPRPSARLMEAIFLATDQNGEKVASKLAERSALPGLDASETLLGVELLMQCGDPARAWVWLQRHRGHLTDFDARCADYRVESARDPSLALRILESFPQLSLTEARWVRLMAMVATTGDTAAAKRVTQLFAEARPHPSAPLAASAWSLLLLNHMESESTSWEKAYRQAGGSELPVIAGRKLAEPDPKTRSQAVRLLASSTPLPREMIAALLRR
jgi:hypothetical protein